MTRTRFLDELKRLALQEKITKKNFKKKKKKGKSTFRTYFTYKRRAESRHGFLDSALDGACALEWVPPSSSLSYLVVLLSEQV